MSARSARARESWLKDDNDEHFGDAMLLCQSAGDRCVAHGRCQLDGFCFRGLASAEVRRGIERKLDRIEATLREFLQLAFDQRRQIAIDKMRGEVQQIRDNVLQFRRAGVAPEGTDNGA